MTIVVDTSQLKPLVASLQAASKNFGRDAKRALVSTRRTTITATRREIVKQYTIKQKDLKDRLTATNVDQASLSFEIQGRKTPIPLTAYSHSFSKSRGVSVQVKRDGGKKKLPAAFKATVSRFGAVGQTARIFQRAIEGNKRVARLPIKALFGPSAADLIDNVEVKKAVITTAQTVLSKEISRLIAVALNGKN